MKNVCPQILFEVYMLGDDVVGEINSVGEGEPRELLRDFVVILRNLATSLRNLFVGTVIGDFAPSGI